MAWRESTWRDEGREWAWGTLCQGERRESRSETLLTAEEWVRLGWWPLMKYGSRRGGAHADRPTDGWENTYAHMIGESGGCRGGKKALWWTCRAMRSSVVNGRTLPESTGSTSSLRSQANSHLVSLGLCPIHVTHLLMQMREEREMISSWLIHLIDFSLTKTWKLLLSIELDECLFWRRKSVQQFYLFYFFAYSSSNSRGVRPRTPLGQSVSALPSFHGWQAYI